MRRLISTLICAVILLSLFSVPTFANDLPADDITDTVKCTTVIDLYNQKLPIVRHDAIFLNPLKYVNDTADAEWEAPGSAIRILEIGELTDPQPFDGRDEFWNGTSEGLTYFSYNMIWAQIIKPMKYEFVVEEEGDYEIVVVGCGQVKPDAINVDEKDRGFCVSVDDGRKMQVNVSDTMGAFADYIYEYTPSMVESEKIDTEYGKMSTYYVPCYYSNINVHLTPGTHVLNFYNLEYSGLTDLYFNKMTRINYAGAYIQRALSEEELSNYEYPSDGDISNKPTLEKSNIINVWDPAIVGGIFSSGNQTKVELCEEGLLLTYTGDASVVPDPYFTFPIASYYKKFSNDAPSPANANWVCLKLKCTGGDGAMEIFAKSVAGDSAMIEDEYKADGNWEYVMADMSFTTLVDDGILTSMRIDWAANGVEPLATMTIAEVGFFTDEDEAIAYCNGTSESENTNAEENVTTEASVEDNTTVAVEESTTVAAVESVTEAITTVATVESTTTVPSTSENTGCGSVVATAAFIVLAAGCAVIFKKKD